jgi:outer membrane protein assembly factor BamB
MSRAGSIGEFGVTFTRPDSGPMTAKISIGPIYGYDYDVGPVGVSGDTVSFGPFQFRYDPARAVLQGTLSRAVVPVYEIPIEMKRGGALEYAIRPPLDVPVARPEWTFDAGSPLWADVEYADGTVYVAGIDGRVHALDASRGSERWTFTSGAAVRARPTFIGGALYVNSDDGFLYRLDPKRGTTKWKIRIEDAPVVRLPIDQAGSKYDFYASAVTLAQGVLLVGTHDGRVLAVDPLDGTLRWQFKTGGPVLSAPTEADGRVFAGSYDGRIYALDAADGSELWHHATGAAVTSSPVSDGGVVVAGSRSYDLLGLDAATGSVLWNRYVWFSWIESTPRIEKGIAYLGSSDAARIYALDVRSGRSLWEADDHGISWGRVALDGHRVFAAVRYSPSIAVHQANLLALDRSTGAVLWRFPCDLPVGAPHRGFAASPATGGGRVYVGGLDGRVYAFSTRGPS